MPDELTQIGFKEPPTPADIAVLGAEDRTVLMAVNSVCGCAAGTARPESIPRSIPVAASEEYNDE